MYHSNNNLKSIQDACGVFGIFLNEQDSQKAKAAHYIYDGILSLQHRGQSSAGIAVSNQKEITCYKNLGLVSNIFKDFNFNNLPGHLGIGHVRYPTCGIAILENSQPFILETSKWGTISIVHNGNIINVESIKKELIKKNPKIQFSSSSDSDLILHLINISNKNTIEEAFIESIEKVKGAFSIIFLSKNKILAIKDPNGFRPLSIGKINNSYCISSETCSFNEIEAKFIRKVEINELIIMDQEGLKSIPLNNRQINKEKLCIFEFIYISRNDSTLLNNNIYQFRKNLGYLLFEKKKIQADYIVPIPDSGTPIAIGYAQKSNIPLEMGIIRSSYTGRTFIESTKKKREQMLKFKFKFIHEIFKDKKIILVDDSIVRGTVIKYLVDSIYKIGIKEIHLLVGSPPFLNPCFYGIDTPKKDNLIAHTHNNEVESIRKTLNLTSLTYITLDLIYKKFNKIKNNLCDACFTGNYPVR